MRDPELLLAEDLSAEELDIDLDDDFLSDEPDEDEDWPIVEDVRRLLHDS